MAIVTQYAESLQYNGSNGTFICGTWANVNLVSDTGSVLVYEDGNTDQFTVNNGEWLIKVLPFGEPTNILTNTQYEARYTKLHEEQVFALATGYALTPSITGSGGTANVAVELDTTMSGTSYQAKSVLAGTSTLLADLEITSVSITDTDTVTVTVRNNGLVSLSGATVIVTAGELTF